MGWVRWQKVLAGMKRRAEEGGQRGFGNAGVAEGHGVVSPSGEMEMGGEQEKAFSMEMEEEDEDEDEEEEFEEAEEGEEEEDGQERDERPPFHTGLWGKIGDTWMELV